MRVTRRQAFGLIAAAAALCVPVAGAAAAIEPPPAARLPEGPDLRLGSDEALLYTERAGAIDMYARPQEAVAAAIASMQAACRSRGCVLVRDGDTVVSHVAGGVEHREYFWWERDTSARAVIEGMLAWQEARHAELEARANLDASLGQIARSAASLAHGCASSCSLIPAPYAQFGSGDDKRWTIWTHERRGDPFVGPDGYVMLNEEMVANPIQAAMILGQWLQSVHPPRIELEIRSGWTWTDNAGRLQLLANDRAVTVPFYTE